MTHMVIKCQICLTGIIVLVIKLATANAQGVTGVTLGYMRKPAGNNKIKRLLRAPRWSPVRPKVQSETVCAPSRSACSPKVRGQTRSSPRSSPRAMNRRPPLSGGREPREEWSRWNCLKLNRFVDLEPLQNEKANKWTKAIRWQWRFPISCNKTSSSFIFVWIRGARISLPTGSLKGSVNPQSTWGFVVKDAATMLTHASTGSPDHPPRGDDHMREYYISHCPISP